MNTNNTRYELVSLSKHMGAIAVFTLVLLYV